MKPPSLTIGIEEEYQIIDPDTRELKSYITQLLEDGHLKLSSVISGIHGVSGRDMLDALAAGQRDPTALAQLARGSMRGKIGRLEEALDCSFFTDAHAAVLAASPVFAFTQTHSVGTPTSAATESRIAAFSGPSFGSWANTVTSRFTGRQPASRSRSAVARRNSRLSASFQVGSVSG